MTDLELIYLIRESKNKDAFNLLLEKHWYKVFCYTFKWYSLKWLIYNIDETEMKYILYDSFLKLVLETNIKRDYYTHDFVPKIWFVLTRNMILSINKNFSLNFNNEVNKELSDYEKSKIKNNHLISANYSYIDNCTFTNDIFVEYILEITNKFLKANKIAPKNKNWIVEKLSSGGSRLSFEDKDFNEEERINLWREYKKTKAYLKTQISKIIN
ncbi:hypothetical protein [Malacoplasma iowae]|uniref:hypothetical protein n=1 Tax=Malacoplasma iowae TaxID=2116 RepID=UPI0038739E64|nr:hypothetical protein QX181_02355 [Malacoplasma iowae]